MSLSSSRPPFIAAAHLWSFGWHERWTSAVLLLSDHPLGANPVLEHSHLPPASPVKHLFSLFFSFLNWNQSSFCTYGAMIYRDQTRFTQLRYLGKISKFPGISEEGLVCLKARVFFSNCFNLSTNMLPLCKNLAQLVMVWLYIKVLSISK